MSAADWQPSLGDPVAIVTSLGWSVPRPPTTYISRFTKTLIVTGDGRRFRRTAVGPGVYRQVAQTLPFTYMVQPSTLPPQEG